MPFEFDYEYYKIGNPVLDIREPNHQRLVVTIILFAPLHFTTRAKLTTPGATK